LIELWLEEGKKPSLEKSHIFLVEIKSKVPKHTFYGESDKNG